MVLGLQNHFLAQIHEGLGFKNHGSNRWKTGQVFPVPKPKHEPAKGKCPVCDGNSSSPQKTWRNLQSRNNSKTRSLGLNFLSSFLLFYNILSDCHYSDEINYLLNAFRWKKKYNLNYTLALVLKNGKNLNLKKAKILTMVFSLMEPKERIKSSHSTRVGWPILLVGVALLS